MTFGGFEDGSVDLLAGGAGADRLLSAENQPVEPEVALIQLKNSPALDVPIYGLEQSPITAGTWSDAKVLQVDEALQSVHMLLGHTTLLKHAGTSMTFYATGDPVRPKAGFTLWGWNNHESSAIYLTNAVFVDKEVTLKSVYHELAHNWDTPSENRWIPEFWQISKWDQTRSSGDTPSHADGDNWYFQDVAANFARDYGMWSPFDDYATTWEAYFMNKFHGGSSNRTITNKIANVEKLFASLV